jgi:hypothetical protein
LLCKYRKPFFALLFAGRDFTGTIARDRFESAD